MQSAKTTSIELPRDVSSQSWFSAAEAEVAGESAIVKFGMRLSNANLQLPRLWGSFFHIGGVPYEMYPKRPISKQRILECGAMNIENAKSVKAKDDTPRQDQSPPKAQPIGDEEATAIVGGTGSANNTCTCGFFCICD